MNSVLLFIGIMVMYSTPLALAASGSVISESCGVINIGIEGMMTIGAFVGVTVDYFSGSVWLGFLCAGLAGGVFGLLHAAASISGRADQTVSGIAINLIGPGLAIFMCRKLFDGATQSEPVSNKIPTLFSSLPGNWNNLNLNWTAVIALLLTIVMWFVFYKTTWGLHIRAVGEHPAAADTLGVNVIKVRYICVILSGVFSGFAGASVTLSIVAQFSSTVIAGQGFIAIAAVIFGKWTPHGAYLACLLFGASEALTVMLGGTAFPSEILAMLPYVLTLIILILFVGKSAAPKAGGVPYVKGG